MALGDQAFSYHKREYIGQSIQALYNRTKLHFRHKLTYADLLEMLVKPEDREALTRVAKITNAALHEQCASTEHSFGKWGNLFLTFDVPPNKENGFLIPNYAGDGIQKKLSEPVKERLEKALDYAAQRSHEWRLVLSVFDALCIRCNSRSQIKFFMPTIVSLFRVSHCAGHEGDNNYADNLYRCGKPSMIPAVEPELRKAAIEVGMTITRAMMLSDKSTEPPDDFIMKVNGGVNAKTPWSDTTEISWLA